MINALSTAQSKQTEGFASIQREQQRVADEKAENEMG